MKSPYSNKKFASYWNDRVGKDGEAYRVNVLDPVMFKLLGSVENKTVLELGCGNGYLAKKFLRLKAKKVILLDKSQHNILNAKNNFLDSRLDFICQDVLKKWHLSGKVDVVYSSMLFIEIDDIVSPFKQAFKKLKSGGTFIFSIVHPAWDLYYYTLDKHKIPQNKIYGIKGYFDRGWAKYVMFVNPISGPALSHKYGKKDFTVPHYHRTIEDYFGALTNAGFRVANVCEPRQTSKMIKMFPKIQADRPLSLIFKAVKP